MGVEVQHLLLSNRAQTLNRCRFVSSLITGDTDGDQNANDGNDDHQFDERETALAAVIFVVGFHNASWLLHEAPFPEVPDFASMALLVPAASVYYRSREESY